MKFDGDFIVSKILQWGYKWTNDAPNKLKNGTFTSNVSFMGVVYSISICFKNGVKIHFKDSLKLFNASEKRLAEDYGLDTVKGEIDYKKPRPVGYVPTAEEIEYIKNDVYIISYILAEFREQGFKKYTTASSALYEFCITEFPRKDGKVNYQTSFNMFKERHPITIEQDREIRNAYRGGYCYVNPKYKNVEIGEGVVCDVNSMYPYVMYSKLQPYGKPIKHTHGKPYVTNEYPLYVVHINVDFKCKKGYFPCIQNKNKQLLFLGSREYVDDTHGNILDLWVTNIDLELMYQCYDIFSIEFFEWYAFKGVQGGFFRKYIDRFIEMKIEGKQEGNASKKQFAKLYLNSLYGKMGARIDNAVMRPMLNEEGVLRYVEEEKSTGEPVYIPLACFITSYARQVLFSCINANRERFLYSDTDSVHLMGTEPPKGIKIHPTELGAWDMETVFKRAKYLGCKTYVEEENNGNLIVHCAGLNKNSFENVTFDNFRYGAIFPTKKCKSGIGGKYIDDTFFELKKR